MNGRKEYKFGMTGNEMETREIYLRDVVFDDGPAWRDMKRFMERDYTETETYQAGLMLLFGGAPFAAIAVDALQRLLDN